MGKSQSISYKKRRSKTKRKLQKQRKRQVARNCRCQGSAPVGSIDNESTVLEEDVCNDVSTAVEPLATEPVDCAVTTAAEIPPPADENAVRTDASDYYYEDVEDFWRALDKHSEEFWKRCEKKFGASKITYRF